MLYQNYPCLEVNLGYLKENVEVVVKNCGKYGISVAGVMKGPSGIPECSRQFQDGGCRYIASSRIDQLAAAVESGISIPTLLIRIPMLSDVQNVIRYADYSLESEISVLEALNEEAGRQHKTHRVIIMADLGDLREGFWDKDEMVEVCARVENDLAHLELAGVGTNVGCYGSVLATPEKLEELVVIARRVEKRIGRKLEIVSGGASSSYMRVLDGNIPEGITNLRIGEQILLARDLDVFYGYDLRDMHQDVFTLKTELIEVKVKPTHPVGELGVDAFGRKQHYEDRGIRKRALAAIGKVDYGSIEEIFPREPGVEVIGASSDHTILDIQDAKRDLQVGDVLEFDIDYASLVYLSNVRDVRIEFV